MAQLIKKDGYLYEDAGYGNFVRRQVFASQFVPDHYVEGELDDEGKFEAKSSGILEESEGPERGPGLGAGETEYAHNRGVSVQDQLKRRGAEDTSEEAAEAAALGGAAAQEYAAKQQEKSSRSRASKSQKSE